MPSNTPMTAAQLLALADRIASAAFHDGYFAHEIDDNNICAIQAAAEAYRAARAASPRTLEELLVREMHEADEAISDAGSPRPDELTKRWNTVAAQLKRHARRLAGEGGAQ